LVSGPIFNDPAFAPVVWTEEDYGCKHGDVDGDH